MYRIYVILIIFFHTISWSQKKLKLKYEAEQFDKIGSYENAEEIYKQLHENDTNNIKNLCLYANASLKNRKLKQTIYLYKKLLKRNPNQEIQIIAYYNIGECLKKTGQYSQAIEHFKIGFEKNKILKLDNYQSKFKGEIKSCVWAEKSIQDTNNLVLYNKYDSLFSNYSSIAHVWSDSTLIFSSNENIYNTNELINNDYSTTKLYQINTNSNGKKIINELNTFGYNSINGTFSNDKQRFYYSLCNPNSNKCKLMYTYYENNMWSKPDTLIGQVNINDENYTMPSFAKINNKEYLFFCSDQLGGKGGLDIYVGEIMNEKTINKIKNLTKINSIEDDITPFYNQTNNALYFSSKWLNNYGGYDVYKAELENLNIKKIENVGIPINSEQNDLYYFEKDDMHIVTSNRNLKNNKEECCNHIYIYKIGSSELQANDLSEIDTLITYSNSTSRILQKEKHITTLKKLFPIALYFHNDIPNPKTNDTTTSINYKDTYDNYLLMINEYKTEYSKGLKLAEEIEQSNDEMNYFFQDYVEKGYIELNKLLEILEIELNNGVSFEIKIKGYASPLAKTKYNEYLSKRRIQSIKNYIENYKNGELKKYLNSNQNGAKLTFKSIPFGESKSSNYISDNPNDIRNSIYSINAALERKIEILSVEETDNEIIQHIKVDKQIIDIGKINSNSTRKITFQLENKNNNNIVVNNIHANCKCITIEKKSIELLPNQKQEFTIELNCNNLKNKFEKSIYLKSDSSASYLRLILIGEIE